MIGVGIVGYGYWGPNLARAFAEAGGFEVRAICDPSPERLEAAGRKFPVARLSAAFADVLADSRIDAIVIATPVATHFDLALAALRSGRDLFLEKPIAETSEAAIRLIEEAHRRNRVLMVDHPYLYTPAIREVGRLVHSGDLGALYYYDSVRVNLGRFQPDVNVLWDLAVHDLAILDFLTASMPERVSATGVRHFNGEPYDLAYLTLFYPDSVLAHIHVSWIAPVKIRRTLIGGSRRMVVYDDLEPSEKVRIYDNGVRFHGSEEARQRRIGYRNGDLHIPHLEVRDALEEAARHFGDCLERKTAPLSSGEAGLRVVSVLEAATQSLERDGRPVVVSGLEVNR